VIGWYLRLAFARWLIRVTGKMVRWGLLVVVLVGCAPVTVVAGVGWLGAWLRGWPPARLRRAAWWSLPMPAAYLTARGLAAASVSALPHAVARDWLHAYDLAVSGQVVTAFALTAPLAIPAGLLAASGLWAWRIYAMETGLAGMTATAPVVFDARQWRRASAAARGRVSAPGAFPLATADGQVVMGATIRAVGHRWRPALTVHYSAMGRHQVIVGSSGSGKTNLMMRTWAGWYAAAQAAYWRHGAARPLLIVMDCKGGPDSRVKAARTRALLHAAGARRVAIWPDEATLSLWTLPPDDLAVTLFQLIESATTGPAAYYADVTQAVIRLAVTAPPGPPASAAQFLQRLDPGWLEQAWAGDASRLAAVTAARRLLPDVSLRYRTLLERLGPALDGPGSLPDADAWYFILEGTREQSVAEAQALAITELVAHTATAPASRRVMLLACDDYSAVSSKVPLWQLYERGRSLGIGVQVSAQSWQGLGADDDERTRICATADGGIWLMRTPYPQPISSLAGTRRIIETATKVIGGVWGDEGSSRVQHAWTADPGIARRLATGQAGFIHAGGCTWTQIARPRPSPLSIPPPPPTVVTPPPAAGPAARQRPAVTAAAGDLDEVFGSKSRP
jgi:hypothetical protein